MTPADIASLASTVGGTTSHDVRAIAVAVVCLDGDQTTTTIAAAIGRPLATTSEWVDLAVAAGWVVRSKDGPSPERHNNGWRIRATQSRHTRVSITPKGQRRFVHLRTPHEES